MTARGIVRRGSLVSSPSGAAASKPMNASRQKIIPWKAGRTPSSPGRNTLSVFWSAFTMSNAEINRKIDDLDDPEDDARPRRDPDAPVGEPPDDEPAQDRQPEPGVFEVDSEVGRQEDRAVEAEPSEEERHDQGLGQREAPRDEPAEERSEAVADVGEHPAGGWQVLRELGHGVRREQHRDHREEHGQGRDAAGERRGRADRQCRRHSGRHVGDRLEQHLGQPDGVALQGRGCVPDWSLGHGHT